MMPAGIISRVRLLAGIALICLCLGPPARGQATLRVPQDFSTIQAAIGAAVNGDTVLVAAGTYVENINFLGKAITVTSEMGPAVTIIDGNQNGSVVTFISGEGPNSVLNGFTIRNGNTSASQTGAGIKIRNSSPTIIGNRVVDNTGCTGIGIDVSFGSPVIQGNLIQNNVQTGCSTGLGGAGIAIGGNSMAQVLDNIIADNVITSGNGGGIALNAAGLPVIRGNIISGNRASGVFPNTRGGGILLFNQTDALIVQNLILGNSAGPDGLGGGIAWLTPFNTVGPTILNNTILDNDAPDGGSAIFADGFDAQARVLNNVMVGRAGQTTVFCGNSGDTNPPIMGFNDVFSPGGTNYGGICADQTGMNGNISADPLFVDAAIGNFHLQPGSPAVDSGDSTVPELPPTDIDGDARVLDGNSDTTAVVDMGFDELAFTQVMVSPASLVFPDQVVNTTSAPQVVTVANTGSTGLHVSSVTVSGDFAVSDNCRPPEGIAAGDSCDLSVTFTPQGLGNRTGEVTLLSNADGSPHVVSLSGTGVNFVPVVGTLSPDHRSGGSAEFELTVLGSGFASSSEARWNGSARATTFISDSELRAVIPASDIAVPGTAQVTVFNPGPGGGESNAVTFTVSGFSLSGAPASVTVRAGQTATYTVTVTAQLASFEQSVSLACSNLPALTTCLFSPASVTPGATMASSTLMVSTTAPVAQLVPAKRRALLVPILAAGLGLAGLVLCTAPGGRRRRSGFLAACVLLVLSALAASCGGGGMGPVPRPGTPTGSHSITITGMSGSLSGSTAVTLVVQ